MIGKMYRFAVGFACTLLLSATLSSVQAQGGDAALIEARRADRVARGKDGKPATMPAVEHIRRAGIYLANRDFGAAREHWQTLIDDYPNDSNVPAALFGMARSYFQERRYEEAFQTYEKVARQFPQTKEGREGLNFAGSSLLRMSRSLEAADRYREYIDKYPNGERIDTAHLNVIDCYREAGQTADAVDWVNRTRQRFAGTPTDTNALFALLRLEIANSDWETVVRTADELLSKSFSKGVSTGPDEVEYLKAYSLERGGRQQEAIRTYLAISASLDSYYV